MKKKKIVIKPKNIKIKPKLKVAVKPKIKLKTISEGNKKTVKKTVQRAKKTDKVVIGVDIAKQGSDTSVQRKVCGKCKRDKRLCKCGRPTKYSEEILIKTIEYIDSCQPIEIRRVKGESARGMTYQLGLRPNYPKVWKLAKHLDVHKSTLREWANKYPEFSDLLEYMIEIQEGRLEEMGLSGEIDGSLSKFILSARHGLSEKKDLRVETATGLFDSDDDDE